MPLYMIRRDITRMDVDAIVDPTDPEFSGSGGTDLAIHRAAGPALEQDLARRSALKTGEAVLTNGYRLPAKYIIHTVGPIWEGGNAGEAEALAACYRSCLRLAAENGCRSVAFPLISGGTFGFPNDDALRIAQRNISAFLEDRDMDVYIVAYQRHTFNLGAKLFADITAFVDENYIEFAPRAKEKTETAEKEPGEAAPLPDLETMLREHAETFSCMLDRLIAERGMNGPACYRKARVHKSVYSKIMSSIYYKPAKITALAFALALELPWEELKALLASAGYAMTRTSKADTVVEYFVRNRIYDIDEINEALYEIDPDLPLFGC